MNDMIRESDRYPGYRTSDEASLAHAEAVFAAHGHPVQQTIAMWRWKTADGCKVTVEPDPLRDPAGKLCQMRLRADLRRPNGHVSWELFDAADPVAVMEWIAERAEGTDYTGLDEQGQPIYRNAADGPQCARCGQLNGSHDWYCPYMVRTYGGYKYV